MFKVQKRFKTVLRRFYDYSNVLENLRKFSEDLRKFSGVFGNYHPKNEASITVARQ